MTKTNPALPVTGLLPCARAVFDHFADQCRDGNAPGHGHLIPGVWDADASNGDKGGTDCKWCADWSDFRQALSQAKGDA